MQYTAFGVGAAVASYPCTDLCFDVPRCTALCTALQNLHVDTNRVMMLADGEGLFHSRLGREKEEGLCCRGGTVQGQCTV